MNDLLVYVALGLAAGSVYALAGLGLVLTYKTSGILNLAHGALATTAAYLFYWLWVRHDVSWWIAAPLVVVVVAVVAGTGLEQVARRLERAPVGNRIGLTVGLLLAIQTAVVLIAGRQPRSFPSYLPTGVTTVAGVRIGQDQLIIVFVTTTAAAGLLVFFRRTRTGLSMSAVVDNPVLLQLAKTSDVAVRRRAWILGSGFAALSGVLIAPTFGLDANILTLLIVQAFGAAAVGRFTSLPLTYAGGLTLGVAGSLMTKFSAGHDILQGLPAGLPFLILFAALILVPPKGVVVRPPAPQPMLGVDRSGATVVAGMVLLALPWLAGPRTIVLASGLVLALVLLSLQLLVGLSGQVSLCHAAFMAVGASTFAHLHSDGWPFGAALLAAGAVAIPVGMLVALPAVRLSGTYLALATFGFGVLVEKTLFRTPIMFGNAGYLPITRPHLPGQGPLDDRGMYLLVLGILALTAVTVMALARTRLGRLLRALGDSPAGLTSVGSDVNVTRLLVFGLSAFLAAVGGALSATLTGSASPLGVEFTLSLLLLAVLLVAGRHLTLSPVAGGLGTAAVASFLPSFSDYQPLLFGAAAIGVVLVYNRPPPTWLRDAARRAETRSASPVRRTGLTRVVA